MGEKKKGLFVQNTRDIEKKEKKMGLVKRKEGHVPSIKKGRKNDIKKQGKKLN